MGDPSCDDEPLTEIVVDVLRELHGRLEGDERSEQDDLAINSAAIKAARRGFLLGVAVHSEKVNQYLRSLAETEPIPANVNTWIHNHDGAGVEPDPWAEAYGSQESDVGGA